MPPKTTYNEQELMILLHAKNESTFNYLYDTYSGALLGIILRIIPDAKTACSVLQKVFVSILRQLDDYDNSKLSFFCWMQVITRTSAIEEALHAGSESTYLNPASVHYKELADAFKTKTVT